MAHKKSIFPKKFAKPANFLFHGAKNGRKNGKKYCIVVTNVGKTRIDKQIFECSDIRMFGTLIRIKIKVPVQQFVLAFFR